MVFIAWATVWDPNKALGIGEWSTCEGGWLERFYCNWKALHWTNTETSLELAAYHHHGFCALACLALDASHQSLPPQAELASFLWSQYKQVTREKSITTKPITTVNVIHYKQNTWRLYSAAPLRLCTTYHWQHDAIIRFSHIKVHSPMVLSFAQFLR